MNKFIPLIITALFLTVAGYAQDCDDAFSLDTQILDVCNGETYTINESNQDGRVNSSITSYMWSSNNPNVTFDDPSAMSPEITMRAPMQCQIEMVLVSLKQTCTNEGVETVLFDGVVLDIFVYPSPPTSEQELEALVDDCGNPIPGCEGFITVRSSNNDPNRVINDGTLISYGGFFQSCCNNDVIDLRQADNLDVVDCVTEVMSDKPVPLSCSATSNSIVSCFDPDDGTASVFAEGGTGDYTYVWSNGQTGQMATGLSTGYYTVTVTDDNTGCTTECAVEVGPIPPPLDESIALDDFAIMPYPNNLPFLDNQTTFCDGDQFNFDRFLPDGRQSNREIYTWSSSNPNISNSDGSPNFTMNAPMPCQIETAEITLTITCEDDQIEGARAIELFSGIVRTVTVHPAPPSEADLAGLVDLCTGEAIAGCEDFITISSAPPGAPPIAYEKSTAASSITVTYEDPNEFLPCCDNLIGVAKQVDVLVESCIVETTINLPPPLECTTVGTDANCNGATDGRATVTPSGGSGTYTYQWDAAAGNQTTATATTLAAGDYTVIVTDGNGCTKECTVTIGEPTALELTCTPVSVKCHDGSDGAATVGVTGGTSAYTYKWDAAAKNQTTATATALAAGDYTVTVTDGNGCTKECTVNVGEPTALVLSSSTSEKVSCPGGSDGTATVTPSGGSGTYTYKWDVAADNQTTATAIDLAAGEYNVTVTDGNMCTMDYSVTVDAVSFTCELCGPLTICGGSQSGGAGVTINGDLSGPFTYEWSDMSTNSILENVSGGTYELTVSSGDCETTCSIVIEELDELTAECSKTEISCNGETDGTATVLAGGGNSPYTYKWSHDNMETGATVNDLAPGDYTVTVTDDAGCMADCMVTISTKDELVATCNIDSEVSCANYDGAISVSVTGGTGPYTYNWSNDAESEGLSELGPGDYSVIVTDANGCTATCEKTLDPPTGCLDMSISITDPCSCSNPNNKVSGDGRFFFNDTLKVESTTPIFLHQTDNNIFDVSLNMIPVNEPFVLNTMTGEWELEIFTEADVPSNIVLRNDNSTEAYLVEACTICPGIPTMGEWGLLILALLILIVSTITIKERNEQLGMA